MKRHYLCNSPRVRGGTTNSNKNRLGTFVNGVYLPPEIPAYINEFLPEFKFHEDKAENIHAFPAKEFRIHPKRKPGEIPDYWDDPPAPERVGKPDMAESSPYNIMVRGVPDVTEITRRRGPGGLERNKKRRMEAEVRADLEKARRLG